MGPDFAAGMQTLFFCLTLIVGVMVGLFGGTFLAHAYLVVASSSAVGTDKVDWPDEPMLDKFRQAVHLAYFLALSLVPAGFVGRLARLPFLPADPVWRVVLGALFGLWLLFPLGILSSLTASTRWTPLHPRLLANLVKRPGSVCLFYLFTAVLIGVPGALCAFALRGPLAALVPASLLGSAALLIHARLLGRLTWVLNGASRPPKEKPRRKKRRRPAPPITENAGLPLPVPPLPQRPAAADDEDEEGGTYGLSSGAALANEELELYKEPFERTEGTFAVEPEPPPDVEAEKARRQAALPTPEQIQSHMRQPREPGPPAHRELLSGVFPFPWYSSNWQMWLMLSIFLGAMIGLTRLAISFYPA